MINTKKIKIALICNYRLMPERIGGMDRFYVAFDQAFKVLGAELDWYFPSNGNFEFYNKLNIIGDNEEEVKSLALKHMQQHQKSYDLVITHFIELCIPFYKDLRAFGNPKVMAVDHNPRPLAGFPLKKRIINKLKGLLYGRYIDVFVGVSRYTTDQILKDYGQFLKPRVKVIYNGIKTAIYRKRQTVEPGRFIVVSHLRPSKGIADLISALTTLDPSFLKRMQIDIYGEGPSEDELKNMVSTNGLDHVVHFKGSSSRLNELFQHYAYMIQPTYMECFSLSILESLAADVPVITTQVGGNLEVIEHGVNGFVFQAGDIDRLNELLSGIMMGEYSIQPGVNALVEQRFDLNHMVAGHIGLCQSVLGIK